MKCDSVQLHRGRGNVRRTLSNVQQHGGTAGVLLMLTLPSLTFAQEVPADEMVTLTEVIVTAQRRAESLQKVPISVAAFTAEQVQEMGIVNLDRLATVTPSVNFQSFSTVSFSNVAIRGVGSHLSTPGVEQGVAVYVDDVFIGTYQAYNFGMLDAGRIEVVRGPQGTLFGKNALGGAIRIFSATPSGEPELRVSGSYGSDSLYRTAITANLPATDDLIFRVSAGANGHDAYVTNTAGPDLQDQEQTLAKVQMLARLTDAMDLSVNFDWTRDSQSGLADGLFDTIGERVVSLDSRNYEQRDLQGVVATFNYRAPSFTVTSVTGFRKMDLHFGSDNDHLPQPWLMGASTHAFRQLSEEIRLASEGSDKLHWLVGGYYYSDRSTPMSSYTLLDVGPSFGVPYGYTESSRALIETETFAAFADATYSLSSIVDISAGVRYTKETKDARYAHTNTTPGFPGLFAPALARSGSLDLDKVSPRVVLTTKWTDSFMSYASVARGIKGGGFNVVFAGQDQPLAFGPELAWNYEIGMKTTWLDRRLRLNLSAFYFDWKDQQVQAYIPNPNAPGVLLSTANAAASRSQGADLEIEATPVSWLTLAVGYSYNDASFEDYPNSPSGDLSDHPLPLNSKHSVGASFGVRKPITSQLDFVAHGDYSYKSESFFDTASTQRQGGYDLVNARIGVASDTWEISLFGTNVFDTAYRTSAFPNFLGQLSATVNDPASYGVEVTFKL